MGRLTRNLLYFGWCSLKIVSGLDINAFQVWGGREREEGGEEGREREEGE
jgi:hypothetical protein